MVTGPAAFIGEMVCRMLAYATLSSGTHSPIVH